MFESEPNIVKMFHVIIELFIRKINLVVDFKARVRVSKCIMKTIVVENTTRPYCETNENWLDFTPYFFWIQFVPFHMADSLEFLSQKHKNISNFPYVCKTF